MPYEVGHVAVSQIRSDKPKTIGKGIVPVATTDTIDEACEAAAKLCKEVFMSLYSTSPDLKDVTITINEQLSEEQLKQRTNDGCPPQPTYHPVKDIWHDEAKRNELLKANQQLQKEYDAKYYAWLEQQKEKVLGHKPTNVHVTLRLHCSQWTADWVSK